MSTCSKCKRDFPPELLAPLLLDNMPYSTHPVCPICALKLTNKYHGITRSYFDGELAESMRQQALAHIRKKKEAKNG